LEKDMESNRDWKAPVALVLAGLALFVALSGRAGSHSPEGWPRFLEHKADSFIVPPAPAKPFEMIPPLEPTVPAPGTESEPFSEMPPFKGEMFDRWGERRGPGLQPGPELKIPNLPNVELRIRNEEHIPSLHGLGDYMLALFQTWFAPLANLVQPLAILLLAWIVIRQARRRTPVAASSDDITTPEGAQNGQ
jgi:hypothetical protein